MTSFVGPADQPSSVQRFLAVLDRIADDVAVLSQPAEVVATIAEGVGALDGISAASVGISLGGDEPLRLAAVDGFERSTIERWAEIPRATPVPLCDVLRTGETLSFPDRASMLTAYPDLRPEIEKGDHQAWAVAPIVFRAEVKGVLGMVWNQPRELQPNERLFLSALGKLGGEALVRAVRDRERQALLLRLADTVEEERAAIAADLHDDAIQRLAATAMRLGSLDVDGPTARVIDSCEDELTTVVTSLRDLVFTLLPPEIDRFHLGDTIRDLVSWRFGESQMLVTVVDKVNRELTPALAITAYRIIQEGLTNVYKHAGATKVTVSITESDGRLRASVTDDGSGSDPLDPLNAETGHVGFRTMRERAESLGGQLHFVTSPGTGFELTVDLPFDD